MKSPLVPTPLPGYCAASRNRSKSTIHTKKLSRKHQVQNNYLRSRDIATVIASDVWAFDVNDRAVVWNRRLAGRSSPDW